MKFQLSEKDLELDVSLIKSNLNIVTEDREDMEVVFENLTKSAIQQRFKVKYDGEELDLKESKSYLFQNQDQIRGNIKLYLPRKIKSYGDLKTKGGNIKINSLYYNGDVKMYGGNFKVTEKLIGSNEYKIYGGNIDIEYFEGGVEIKTYGGNIKINDGKIEYMETKVYGGNLKINSIFELKKDASIKMYGGNIKIDVEKYNTESKIYAIIMGGKMDITGDFPEDKLIKKKYNKTGIGKDIVSNIPESIFNMFSKFTGNKSDGENKDVEVEVEEKQNNYTEEVNKVLDMLDEGKINAEQAQKLIKSIKES
ncbi:MAG: hypothetical protein FXF47_04585 [Candidatus Mcinerneyibacterium aminivorans]|uniref:YvlB/LiaX N-terminal domain-containing protein n=1 Tax=Candidatus Mcinerneyibacterium aminivorans TaxID=2703815 RepID=A0A5D0MJH6_9BACT|nr:MAG: hypothetical protein FXF47_04585 [Candidatus Mcinerneyibacterium aminivorans]